MIGSAQMDVDNRRIVLVAGPTNLTTVNLKDGLFRFDPSSGKLETLMPAPAGYSFRSLLVNQDGDYVVGTRIEQPPPSSRVDYAVLKVDALRRVTTVLSTVRDLGESTDLTTAIGCNIDTGNYLITAVGSSPTYRHDWVHGVLDVDVNHDGRWTTFSNGGGYTRPGSRVPGCGWLQGYGHVRQDFATGALRDVYNDSLQIGNIHELEPGRTPRTTLYVCGSPPYWHLTSWTAGFPDLQSAARPRYLVPAFEGRFPKAHDADGFLAVDQADYFAVGFSGYTRPPPRSIFPVIQTSTVFELYRGRHLASVKTGPARWTIRLSLPSHAGRRYVAAAGISGVRPPIRLPDGRRIWLNADDVTRLSLLGAARPFFDPGPGALDANGEAAGRLDLSALGPTGGLPVWIAVLVLDPHAPLGIAYIPDTHVIRVP
jgi:hypothetical protein